MNFAAFDLNLLRVFDAMMMELSTTRAGQRVGLSQPAVSSALGRLRHATGDELFVRDGNRMVPTSRALAMSGPVRAALNRLEEVLQSTDAFDPARCDDTFRIIGSDYFSNLLMPALIARVNLLAPAMILQMLDEPSANVLTHLSEGRADLAVDRGLETPEWIGSRTLFRSYILCVAGRGNQQIRAAGIRPGERVPADLYCRMPQAILSMDGTIRGTVDVVLEARGLRRHIALTLPHFQAVAQAAASSELLANLPVHFAHHAARLLDLDIYLPPFDPPIIDVNLF